jgi:acetyltransferase-like isoleucine patch superfamily enzyme
MVDDYRVTMYGSTSEIRPFMLTFCESDEWLPPCRPAEYRGGAVLCTMSLAERVDHSGHVPIVCQSPRERFFDLFRELPFHEPDLDIHGELSGTCVVGSRAFKTHNGRMVANHGGVYIAEGATIGEFVAIDCGIYGEYTEIHEGVHIDNHVHIGHSAIIGAGCTIVANAGVGGWARIGTGVRLNFGCTIRDNVTVGDGAVVGMGAVVVGDVPANAVVAGCPAKVIRWKEQ